MITVRNKEQLIHNGTSQNDQKARSLALESIEKALNAVDPIRIIRTKLLVKDSSLYVDGLSFNLDKFRHVFVVGGGKASGFMAEGLEKVLGDRLTEGYVNAPENTKYKTEVIEVHGASHPVPNESGVEGTRHMIKLAERAETDDLVICLISGGGSSLMPLPRGEISIAEKRELTSALLRSGATISEINSVRKHISDFKGGWLAKSAYPATVLNLILSDVVGDPLDSIASGPTVPDSTTFSGALRVLKKYGLWSGAPMSIQKILLNGEKGLLAETPKEGDKVFKKVHNVIVGNNRSASLAACKYLKSKGLNTLLLTAGVEGEARHVGTILGSIAREVAVSGNPIARPAGIVAGGETTVTVIGKGLGSRNQEIPLAAALKLDRLDGLVTASMSTDGIDGPTDAAGAIADGMTFARASKAGLSVDEYLMNNDSYHFFLKLGDLVLTGATGTNVNDISVIVAV